MIKKWSQYSVENILLFHKFTLTRRRFKTENASDKEIKKLTIILDYNKNVGEVDDN